jgi:hypothetical protein
VASQQAPTSTKAHPTSSDSYDDDPVGRSPTSVGVGIDSQRADVLDLLVSAMQMSSQSHWHM